MSHHPFPWQDAFLAALRRMPIVQHACNAVGIERCTAYRARQADKDFAQRWEEAMEAGIDLAEAEAFRRGVFGFEEPVVYQGRITPVYVVQRDAQGEVVLDELTNTPKYVPLKDDQGREVPLTVRKHSDAMLALVLKGRRKKVYAERTELTGADGEPLQPMDETARAARAAALLEVARQRQQRAESPEVKPEDYA